MKFVLAISIFITATLSAHVCIPGDFTTDQISHIPELHDFFLTKIWYSTSLQKQRFDVDVIVENSKVQGDKISFILDYNKGVYYTIMYLNHTSNCTQGALNGKLDDFCLSKNAEHRGTALVGGVLIGDNYIERHKDGSVKLDLLVVANINVPVRSVHKDKSGRLTIDEYFNFQEKVDHDAFVIPEVCKNSPLDEFSPKLSNHKFIPII